MQVLTAASANGPGAPQLPPVTMLSIPVHQRECPPYTIRRRLGGPENRTGLVWRRENFASTSFRTPNRQTRSESPYQRRCLDS